MGIGNLHYVWFHRKVKEGKKLERKGLEKRALPRLVVSQKVRQWKTSVAPMKISFPCGIGKKTGQRSTFSS